MTSESTELLDKELVNDTKSGRVQQLLTQYFFVIGLCLVVLIAWLFPDPGSTDGVLVPSITSAWVTVIIIFFINGIVIKTTELKKATVYWQLNIFIQLIIFVWFPVIGYIICLIFTNININSEPFNEALLNGLIILCCIPSTIAACIVYTQSSGGNEAAAIINATLSNMFGIALTPLLIYLFLGNLTNINAADVIFRLSVRVIVPFCVGQIMRCILGIYMEKFIEKYKNILKKINEIAILYIVFCAMSDTFNAHFEAKLIEIIIMAVIVIFVHIFTALIVWYISGIRGKELNHRKYTEMNDNDTAKCNDFMRFNMSDRIAILFCSIQKTVAFGLPIIETLYANDDNLGMYILPLLLYVPTELIIDGVLVSPLKQKMLQYANIINNFNEKSSSIQMEIETSNGKGLEQSKDKTLD